MTHAAILAVQSVLDENADLKDENDRLRAEAVSYANLIVKQGWTTTGPKRQNRQKLSDREVKDIRQAYQGGMKQADLASNYGVNPSTISRTVRGFYN